MYANCLYESDDTFKFYIIDFRFSQQANLLEILLFVYMCVCLYMCAFVRALLNVLPS